MLKVPLCQTVFDAMDQVLGNEHTMNPRIMVDLNALDPIRENRPTTQVSTNGTGSQVASENGSLALPEV